MEDSPQIVLSTASTDSQIKVRLVDFRIRVSSQHTDGPVGAVHYTVAAKGGYDMLCRHMRKIVTCHSTSLEVHAPSKGVYNLNTLQTTKSTATGYSEHCSVIFAYISSAHTSRRLCSLLHAIHKFSRIRQCVIVQLRSPHVLNHT